MGRASPDRPESFLDGCDWRDLQPEVLQGQGRWAGVGGSARRGRRERRGRDGESFGFAGAQCSMGLLIVALLVGAGAARCAMSEDDSGTWSLRSRQSCPPARSGSRGCASAKGKVSAWAQSDTQLWSSWGRGSGRDDFPPHSWLWPSAAHCPPPWLLSPSRLVTSSITSVQRWNLCSCSFLV